jgi:hypothetical protein
MPREALCRGSLEGFKKCVRVFKEASKNLKFDFLINKYKKNFTTSAYTESTDLTS